MASSHTPTDHKVSVTVEVGRVGDATVFVQIDTVGRTLSQEQASARARQAVAHFAAANANVRITAPHSLRLDAQRDPEALFRSWAMPSSNN